MIEPVPIRGASVANVTCSGCGHVEQVHCKYFATGKPDVRQVKNKLKGSGWQEIKGKILCPTCMESRKKANMNTKSSTQEPKQESAPREPSRAQRREIILALEVVYDVEKQRYNQKYTDRAVAEEIGNGVMPGWVAKIRDEAYGSAGGNEEMEALASDIEKQSRANDRLLKRSIEDLYRDVDKAKAQYQATVDAAARACQSAFSKVKADNEALAARLKSLDASLDLRVGR